MRILGIDYGTVRAGLAISDELGFIAQPLESVTYTSFRVLVDYIASECVKRSVGKIIIGLPKHMSGNEGDSAVKARGLGNALSEKLGIPVIYQDERMTSKAAERALLESDMSRKKRREKIDSVAAAIILQSYLDSNSL
ncbi:MAG: hypothetical protein A2020_10685 [Lentisphaerae bacterium GWF2_45_14]|nr:MAG: hypothetical protein A2020_10685 [Lentisphaerae bacterium GWF2_45_14]